MSRTPIPDQERMSPERKLSCRWYEECLDYAVERKWSGFSCGHCSAYRPMEWDMERLMRDALACKALLITVFDPKGTKYLHKHRIVGWLDEDERKSQGYSFEF